MRHKNDNPTNAKVLFYVPRAIASGKMHYFTKLKELMLEEANRQPQWRFTQTWPHVDTASGVINRLSHTTWLEIKEKMNCQDYSDYLKHIFTKHDGEARFVTDPEWVSFADVDLDIDNARLWNYQFVTKLDVRNWLYERSQESRGKKDLDAQDIRWILEKEEQQTNLLKFSPASGGSRWSIRSGFYITLAELFWYGCFRASCYDLYVMYTDLPIFIYKRMHSLSNAPGAQKTRNAKSLKHAETGRWSLNASRSHGGVSTRRRQEHAT